jgi:L-ascorbate metabolism protein UlaG (beta-lactamase superfamily)
VSGRRRVSYLGHSTTAIELDGVRLLTDPLLRRGVLHLRRSAPAADHGAIDALLISHGHQDHLDLRSLGRLPRETPVVLPRGLGEILARRGFSDVREVEEGDEVAFGDVTVRATHAEHPGRSLPGRASATLGFAVLGTARVFFAGDTGLFNAMDGLVPGLDLALLPIWGWGPTIGPGHLDPRSAAEALTLLQPRLAVPIHWGTLRPFYRTARAEFLHAPADDFVEAARELAPGVAVRVLAPGESLDF